MDDTNLPWFSCEAFPHNDALQIYNNKKDCNIVGIEYLPKEITWDTKFYFRPAILK